MGPSRSRRISFSCRYLGFRDKNDVIWRLPMVHLRVSYEGISIRTTALVDSGATCTFLPADIAEILNLPRGDTQPVVGAGGMFTAYNTKADLAVLKGFRPEIEFPECPVLVPETVNGIPHAVLGRDSIFSAVQITFKERELKIHLKSY